MPSNKDPTKSSPNLFSVSKICIDKWPATSRPTTSRIRSLPAFESPSAQNTVEQVVARVLALARTHNNSSFAMGTLQAALQPPEETQFRQAIQCTLCISPGHSALDCPSRPHCLIYHSENHTVEQCEYNMLNRNTATTVHQIEPLPNPAHLPPLPKEVPKSWEDNRPHYHTVNAPDTMCCNHENPYRNDTQPHPNHV